MRWGSTCLQVCSSEPQHQIIQTDKQLDSISLACRCRFPCVGQGSRTAALQPVDIYTEPLTPTWPHVPRSTTQAAGRISVSKKEGLHAGEYGCRGLMSLRSDDNPGSSCNSNLI